VTDVRPFRGLRYDSGLIGDISSVICPPYDVVSPEDQLSYHRASPYNAIRLELGEESASDTSADNKYVRAARDLQSWLDNGALTREDAPAFYVYQHLFSHEGVAGERWGLTARMRLEEQGAGALPHESVMEERISDRLQLLRHCRVNTSPIMGMVRPGARGLTEVLNGLSLGRPDVMAVDRDGVTHSMWIVTDEAAVEDIRSCCRDKTVYIADGHHRYETAVAYQRERKAESGARTGREAYNFVLVTLTGAEDPGLLALPTHRLARLNGVELAGLRQSLERLFALSYLEPAGAVPAESVTSWLTALREKGTEGVAIGLYGLDGERLCILTPKDKSGLAGLMPPEKSREWKSLDVSMLHWIVLRRLLGIDSPQKEVERLEYTRDGLEAVSRVDSGKYQLAFLMNPIPIPSVLAVADAGDRMPPKSTYFYPKLPTGLVINPLWDD
jgi:uncharacterized protein (DUF1015 family)